MASRIDQKPRRANQISADILVIIGKEIIRGTHPCAIIAGQLQALMAYTVSNDPSAMESAPPAIQALQKAAAAALAVCLK